MELIYILFSLIPLFIGAVIAIWNSNAVNEKSENIETWIRAKKISRKNRSKWFKYLINPLLFVAVKLCDWTDSLTHRGLKNGIRISAVFYFTIFWIGLIFVAGYYLIILAIGLFLVWIAYTITFSILFNEQAPKIKTGIIGAGGKKFYSGTSWLDENLKGRIDNEGNIYSGTSWLNEKKIGRIDEEGNIYEGNSWLNENKVGRINNNGDLIEGKSWWDEKKTGRIDEDGNFYEGTSWLNEKKTGRFK